MLIKIHLKPTVMVHTPITLFWRDVTRFLLLCPAQRALSDDVVWCLSVAYIGPKSRTERPRKTTIGTEVAHVTRDSDITFKVKRSMVKVTRPLCSGGCSGGVRTCWPWETATTLPYVGRRRALRRPRGEERGGGISWRKKRHMSDVSEVSNCSPNVKF